MNIPGTGPDITGADGTYQVGLDHLGQDNTPLENLFLAADEGVNHLDQVYWPRSASSPSPVSIGDLAPGDDLAVARSVSSASASAPSAGPSCTAIPGYPLLA